jgi:hypothetical protein
MVDTVTLDFFRMLRFPLPTLIHFSPPSSGTSTVLVPRDGKVKFKVEGVYGVVKLDRCDSFPCKSEAN